MRVNVGCGRHVLDGWVNVDVQVDRKARRPPEHICNFQSIPLPDGCADELMAIHCFEHIYYWEVQEVLAEWHRILKPKGLLVLELPNLVKCCQNIIDGRGTEEGAKHPQQMGMWGLYGDPQGRDPYMHHRWGWSPLSLKALLLTNGFTDVVERETQWHQVGRKHRDMRVEAHKV